MENPAPRAVRLQAIKDKWFPEPLKTPLTSLTDDPTTLQPATCNQFVRSFRMSSAFSSLHEAPDAAGMTPEAALANDRRLNAELFGVENPKMLMQELSNEMGRAPGGQVNPDVLKKAVVVLDAVEAGSVELAKLPPADKRDEPLQLAHLADAAAANQAKNVVAELAAELGISLPLNPGRQIG